jgi:hypothetical protein
VHAGSLLAVCRALCAVIPGRGVHHGHTCKRLSEELIWRTAGLADKCCSWAACRNLEYIHTEFFPVLLEDYTGTRWGCAMSHVLSHRTCRASCFAPQPGTALATFMRWPMPRSQATAEGFGFCRKLLRAPKLGGCLPCRDRPDCELIRGGPRPMDAAYDSLGALIHCDVKIKDLK